MLGLLPSRATTAIVLPILAKVVQTPSWPQEASSLVARLAASSTMDNTSLDRMGGGHMKESSPRSSPSSRGKCRATMEGSPVIALEAALSLNDSGRTRGCTPFPKGLRTMSLERGPLHHQDGQDQTTKVSSTSTIRKKPKNDVPSGAFHEGQDNLPFRLKSNRGGHGRRPARHLQQHRQCQSLPRHDPQHPLNP